MPLTALAICLLLTITNEERPPDTVARLTRLADPVAFLDSEARVEKTLFHWEKSAYMRVGDGARQGVAGFGEIYFLSDGTEIRMFGECHLTIRSSQDGHHLVQFQDLTRSVFDMGTDQTRIELPGGTVVTGSKTWLRLGKDEMNTAWIIRNAGPSGVVVSGSVLPIGDATVDAGEQVKILLPAPEHELLDAAEKADPGLETQDRWEGRMIHLGQGVEATKTDTDLILSGEGLARVGGARIRLPEGGRRIRMWRARP